MKIDEESRMFRSLALLTSIALFAGTAAAQADVRSQLKPITSPMRRAGVYHVATGTWTRGALLANLVGPDTIYNNTCATVYFIRMLSIENWEHRSRIPSTTGPTTDSIFYGTSDSNHRYDERPGCATSYLVNGFEVSYCSSHAGTLAWRYQFASSYTACGAAPLIPQYTLTMTGLPGGTSTGAQICWIVDFDLSGEPGGGIVLSADGNGTYDGPSTVDQFGFGFNANPATFADSTGPVVAGDFAWTGGAHTGALAPCTGTDGTIWDRPVVDPDELGTGMSSNDFFRVSSPSSGPSGSGCYFFGGNPHADFFLRLFAAPDCPPPDPVVKFCAPGVGGIVSCPCGNPQVPAGATKGCDNFAGGGTGGAILSGSGASIAGPADTLGFDVTAGVGSNVTVLFQGTANSTNTRSGAGVRCVSGTLKRLYKGNQSAGAIHFPNNGVSVHDASSAKGYTIVPPITLYYFATYRNSAANGQPGCPGLTFGFNSTNAGSVAWAP